MRAWGGDFCWSSSGKCALKSSEPVGYFEDELFALQFVLELESVVPQLARGAIQATGRLALFVGFRHLVAGFLLKLSFTKSCRAGLSRCP